MSNASEVPVRRVEREEAALVGEILVDAFAADPVGRWISSDPAYPKWCWPMIVPFLLPHDEVYIAGDGLGAAMWVPPAVKLDIKLGPATLWDCLRRFGPGSILRLFRIMFALEKRHPKEPHYYLFAVGVRPEAKGRGIGSALLEPVLRECDSRQVGAYLENSNPLNMPFYERHGFEVRDKVTMPRNGPTLWLMHRDPRPDGA